MILYEDIYPNVDLRLIATDEGFKYDVIAEDIADLDQVEMVTMAQMD